MLDVSVPERMREYWYASWAMSEMNFCVARARRRASGKGVVSSSRGGFPLAGGLELMGPPLVVLGLVVEEVDGVREDKGGGFRPARVRAWKITASGICRRRLEGVDGRRRGEGKLRGYGRCVR